MDYNVSEVFNGVQGEGPSSGRPAIFVRFSGCNLKCKWCDTPYASHKPEQNILPFERICDIIDGLIRETGCDYIVFTGGEPCLWNLEPFTQKYQSCFLGLETNGTLPIRGKFNEIVCSPKLLNSGSDKGLGFIENIRNYEDVIYKFVVGGKKDFEEILGVIASLGIKKNKIWLMPQGVYPHELKRLLPIIATFCMKHGFNMCTRLQIFTWGNLRGH